MSIICVTIFSSVQFNSVYFDVRLVTHAKTIIRRKTKIHYNSLHHLSNRDDCKYRHVTMEHSTNEQIVTITKRT